MNCPECFQLTLATCLEELRIPTGIASTLIYWTITDSTGSAYNGSSNSDTDGSIFIDTSDDIFPSGLFSQYGGKFTFIIRGTGSEPETPICEEVEMTICETTYTCIDIRFREEFTSENPPEPVCDDATVTLNDQDLGAAGEITSGGSKDFDIVNTDNDEVGTWDGTKQVVGDTTIRNQADDWSDTEKPEGEYILGLGHFIDTDQVTPVPFDYKPTADGAVGTCSLPDYGTRVGTVLTRQFDNPFFEVFGLVPFTDRAETADLAYIERGGDNVKDFFTYTEMTDGTLASWSVAGGGNGTAIVVYLLGHYGTGLTAYSSITAQQWEIVSGGVLHTNTNGNPTMICTSAGGYFLGTASGAQEVPLATDNGSAFFVGKKASTTTISRLMTAAGNPSIGIADTTSNSASLNSGTPQYYVDNVALANNKRDELQAATNGLETVVFVEDIGWTSGTWRLSSSIGFMNNFQAGSEVTIFGISLNPQNAYRTQIFNALTTY